MRRHTSLRTTSRSSGLTAPARDVWRVVASGGTGPQWYVDAAPLVFRGGVDRVLGGEGRRWPPPGTPVLAAGDTAGFWRVTEADPAQGRLVLEADVRAPGRVVLDTSVTPTGAATCRLSQTISFEPSGLLGAAYLLVDLPAREAVLELVHRRLLTDLADLPEQAAGR